MPSQVVRVDALRSLGHASISSSYAPLGTAFGHPMRIVKITNSTNADLTFSFDAVIDNMIVPAGAFTLFDLTSNTEQNANGFYFANGTQFFVKGSPSSGSVYLESVYGKGE